MIFISHRGNLNGKRHDENSPQRIEEVLDLGYDVEVDVWYEEDKFYLGHDKPEYETSLAFLSKDKLWLHCKNHAALTKLHAQGLNCFWHQDDDIAITGYGNFWVHPLKMSNDIALHSIFVMPEIYRDYMETTPSLYSIVYPCLGVCSDYVEQIRNDYEKEIAYI